MRLILVLHSALLLGSAAILRLVMCSIRFDDFQLCQAEVPGAYGTSFPCSSLAILVLSMIFCTVSIALSLSHFSISFVPKLAESMSSTASTGSGSNRRDTAFPVDEFKRFMELIPIGMFLCDPYTGEAVHVNSHWCKVTGMDYHEALGDGYRACFHPDDASRILDNWPFSLYGVPKGESLVLTFRMRNVKTNQTVWVRADIVIAEISKSDKVILGILQDITKQKTSEYQLQNNCRLLDEALKLSKVAADSKSQFLANISHEIRTPLNGIIGLTSLLLETKLDPDQYDLSSNIKECSDGLLMIVNDLLDISKMEAGKFTLIKEYFDIGECVHSVYKVFQLRAQQKSVKMSLYVHPDVPKFIYGDRIRYRQILLNLIGNAVKFTNTGSISVEVTVIKDKEEQIMFEVKDTGIGIPGDKMKLLFKSFSQVDASLSRQYGGTGLGLVDQMEGRIWVSSEYGKGSTFSFAIPLKVSDVENDAESRQRRTMSQDLDEAIKNQCTEFKPLRILVAEDNAINRKVLLRILKEIGHQSDSAIDGIDCVVHARKNDYDIILMDIQMPGMSGIEATAVIRNEIPAQKQPRIIALTASALEEDKEKCMKAGLDGYLIKPILPEDLARAITYYSNLPIHRKVK